MLFTYFQLTAFTVNDHVFYYLTRYIFIYRGADKSLARPGRKEANVTDIFFTKNLSKGHEFCEILLTKTLNLHQGRKNISFYPLSPYFFIYLGKIACMDLAHVYYF